MTTRHAVVERSRMGIRRFASQRGIALPITMMALLGVSITGLLFYSLSVGATLLTNRGAIKTQATSLAEAGINAMFASISSGLRSGTLTSATAIAAVTVPTTTLYRTPGDTTTGDGTFSASVVSASGPTTYTTTDNTKSPPVVTYTDVYSVTVQGTGTGTNGVQSTIRATFNDVQLRNNTDGVYNTYPDGALISNGPIVLQGNASTQSSVTMHGAGAMANGVISNVGNAYYVDGPISVAPASYSATQTALTKINDYTGTLTQLSAPITAFETPAMISYEQTQWISDAQSSGNVLGGAVGTTGTGYSPATGTLTAPAYINGDLNVQGGATLTLSRPSGAVGPVVVYVNGNINFTNGNGSIINNGVTLVCTGTFNCGKNSTYSVGNYPAGSVDSKGNSIAGTPMYSDSGLISLSNSSTALSITAGADAKIGICKALNGGVALSGTATLTGSIIAGGSGAQSGIQLAGNPTIIYPGGLNATDQNDPMPKTIQYYTPDTINRWVQTL